MEVMTIERPYLTTAEAEKYTKLHYVTLWRARRDGHLRASGFGRGVRYHIKDLDEFMTARSGGEAQG